MLHETRTMMGGDVVVSSNRAWEAASARGHPFPAGDRELAGSNRSRRDPDAWVRPGTQAKPLARLGRTGRRAVRLSVVRPIRARRRAAVSRSILLKDGGALVRPDLMAQFDLRVGDEILIWRPTVDHSRL